jgi:hypothetical protein
VLPGLLGDVYALWQRVKHAFIGAPIIGFCNDVLFRQQSSMWKTDTLITSNLNYMAFYQGVDKIDKPFIEWRVLFNRKVKNYEGE